MSTALLGQQGSARGAEGPETRPKCPARRAKRAPQGTGPRGQPAGGSPVPSPAGQACIAKPGPRRPPAPPRPSGSTGLAAPPKAEVSPERTHQGHGHPPKTRKSPPGTCQPIAPSEKWPPRTKSSLSPSTEGQPFTPRKRRPFTPHVSLRKTVYPMCLQRAL